MAFFIELTSQDPARKSGPFIINVDSIKVVYQGLHGAVVRDSSNLTIEVEETYEEIKRQIMEAPSLPEAAASS